MNGLLYFGAYCTACVVGYVGAIVYACRPRRAAGGEIPPHPTAPPQVLTMPTQRPPVENDPLAMSAVERIALVEARCWAQDALADDDEIAREAFVAWLREVDA